jgi:hypothetical protein
MKTAMSTRAAAVGMRARGREADRKRIRRERARTEQQIGRTVEEGVEKLVD